MKTIFLKRAALTAFIIFSFHIIVGFIYTSLNETKGMVWLNPIALFMMFYWIYLLISLFYYLIRDKYNSNKWVTSASLISISYFLIYSPYIFEGTFLQRFEWLTVLTFIISAVLMAISEKLTIRTIR